MDGGGTIMNQTIHVTSADAPAPAEHRLGPAHVAQFADFVDAMQSDHPVRVGTKDGRTALAVVVALYQSAACGEPVAVER